MSQDRQTLLNSFQQRIGYQIKNYSLLDQALTHDSVLGLEKNTIAYQRLEWLGDALLKQVISYYLFSKFRNYNEGDLHTERAKLESKEKLKHIAEKLNIQRYVKHGNGLERDRFDRYDCFVESLIGAIYEDSKPKGQKEVTKFICKFWVIEENYCYDEDQNENSNNQVLCNIL
jgi:ribonuclease-3